MPCAVAEGSDRGSIIRTWILVRVSTRSEIKYRVPAAEATMHDSTSEWGLWLAGWLTCGDSIRALPLALHRASVMAPLLCGHWTPEYYTSGPGSVRPRCTR